MKTHKKYNRLQVGSRVECRYFNSMDKKFYGDFFEGKVTDIRVGDNGDKIFTVLHTYGASDLKRKEIRQVLS